MITKIIQTEFGDYSQQYNHGYEVHSHHNCIDVYEEVGDGWLECPCCGLKPRVWEFNNGRNTACGCWNSEIDIFSVHAESIMSVHNRTNGCDMIQYRSDTLRENWNEYCMTMVNPCSHSDLRMEGKW